MVGKPNPMMFRSAMNRIGAHSENTAMIGDRMDTDIVAGIEAGLHTILVLTGISDQAEIERYPFRPDEVLESVADAPRAGGGRRPLMTRLVPAVLRDEPQYRLLFAGQLLSIFGDRVSMLVLPFAVLAVGGTVTGVVAVSIAQFLPFVVLALPAGVWADRFDRKRIVIASDAVRMVTQATAAATLITGTATVPLLAALAALYGAADAFFSPAITALVPAIVSPRNLQPANALRGLTFSLGSVLGPAIGGVLVALLGPGGGFAFDAATFVVSVACLRGRARRCSTQRSRPRHR